MIEKTFKDVNIGKPFKRYCKNHPMIKIPYIMDHNHKGYNAFHTVTHVYYHIEDDEMVCVDFD